MSLMLFQQITGQPSVLYYATDIARQAGFSNTSAASFVSVGLGIVKLVTTLFATTSIENFGRRPLLLGGVSVLTGSLLVLTVLSGERQGTASAYLSLAAILVYTGAYQVRI
jgi:predicted MFS family arabinose efflux permease